MVTVTGPDVAVAPMVMKPDPEPVNEQRSRLAWQCRRGMKELDCLLQSFLDTGFERLAPEERRAFDVLLAYPDPVLIDYLMGRMVPLDRCIADVVLKIRGES